DYYCSSYAGSNTWIF
nr:immunoglobulin light chain junction region [Macaca mulatta]MOW28671.1 immunoglobulin light chain junction region [Macaca mulatta]MOW29512.1 immunoglobulin light chain junction region [Macaca mulatta]MOW29757.1 immunoglobulin light chain junction region [Macaca mulatta]